MCGACWCAVHVTTLHVCPQPGDKCQLMQVALLFIGVHRLTSMTHCIAELHSLICRVEHSCTTALIHHTVKCACYTMQGGSQHAEPGTSAPHAAPAVGAHATRSLSLLHGLQPPRPWLATSTYPVCLSKPMCCCGKAAAVLA